MPKYALVLVDDSGGRAFDYEIPAAMADTAGVGCRVRVPVRTRVMLGTIVGISDTTGADGVRLISELVSDEPALSPQLIRLAEWVANYYCCPLEAALRTVLPSVIRKAEIQHKKRLVARLAREVSDEEIETIRKRAPNQAEVVAALRAAQGPIAVAALSEQCSVAPQTIKALAKKGILTVEPETVERDPHGTETFVPNAKLELNAEQAVVFARVQSAIAANGSDPAPKPLLLHGVTGSGKTEIYLQAIQLVLERGADARSCSCRKSRSRRRPSSVSSRASPRRSTRSPCCTAPQRRRAPRRMAQDPQRPRAHRHRCALGDLCAVRKARPHRRR